MFSPTMFPVGLNRLLLAVRRFPQQADTNTKHPETGLGGHQAQNLAASTDALNQPMSDGGIQDRALRALEVAAVHEFMKSVRSTQASCLRLCNSCREGVTVHRLGISRHVPRSILAIVYPGLQQGESNDSSRVVPHRIVRRVHWTFTDPQSYRRLAREGTLEAMVWAEGQRVEARDTDYLADVTTDLAQVQWPQGTTEISLCCVNRRIDAVAWPPCLERLFFGEPEKAWSMDFRIPDTFDMPLNGATFPAGLREIFLGDKFNHPIEGFAWPGGLERMSLPGFNQSV